MIEINKKSKQSLLCLIQSTTIFILFLFHKPVCATKNPLPTGFFMFKSFISRGIHSNKTHIKGLGNKRAAAYLHIYNDSSAYIYQHSYFAGKISFITSNYFRLSAKIRYLNNNALIFILNADSSKNMKFEYSTVNLGNTVNLISPHSLIIWEKTTANLENHLILTDTIPYFFNWLFNPTQLNENLMKKRVYLENTQEYSQRFELNQRTTLCFKKSLGTRSMQGYVLSYDSVHNLLYFYTALRKSNIFPNILIPKTLQSHQFIVAIPASGINSVFVYNTDKMKSVRKMLFRSTSSFLGLCGMIEIMFSGEYNKDRALFYMFGIASASVVYAAADLYESSSGYKIQKPKNGKSYYRFVSYELVVNP